MNALGCSGHWFSTRSIVGGGGDQIVAAAERQTGLLYATNDT